MKQFEIWMAEIPEQEKSHVQHGRRPVIIVSNDAANKYSPVVTVVPLTSQRNKPHMSTHVYLNGQGLTCGSVALCENVMSLDKHRLQNRMGIVYKRFDRLALLHALSVQLGMESWLDMAV